MKEDASLEAEFGYAYRSGLEVEWEKGNVGLEAGQDGSEDDAGMGNVCLERRVRSLSRFGMERVR